MNEKRIREVIEFEKKAEELLAQATRDAERMPAEAESEARSLLEKARADARAEAQRMLEKAGVKDESARIVSDAEQRMAELDKRAKANMAKAVDYVLQRVTGRA